MKCSDFNQLIQSFTEDTLEEEYYDSFVKHARECSECMDELEIHYMIRVGLERMEDESTKSFDLKEELKEQLLRYERLADKRFKRKVYHTVTIVIAEICILINIIQMLYL
ncbi:MAG: hypothetical protein II919_05285 [Lachnospiraceae bacterium]|nr:hypothetical protein [Lachnospiraceae bacterium]